eukprot:10657_1
MSIHHTKDNYSIDTSINFDSNTSTITDTNPLLTTTQLSTNTANISPTTYRIQPNSTAVTPNHTHNQQSDIQYPTIATTSVPTNNPVNWCVLTTTTSNNSQSVIKNKSTSHKSISKKKII